MNYTNTATYSILDSQGHRHEYQVRIESNKPLTAIGAQRKLRNRTGDKSIIVSRVDAMSYSA